MSLERIIWRGSFGEGRAHVVAKTSLTMFANKPSRVIIET